MLSVKRRLKVQNRRRPCVFVILHGELMRSTEAAHLCGVSSSTVERWEDRGKDVTKLAERYALRRWMREQARRNGVPGSTLRSRLRLKWAPERAVSRAA